MSLILDSPMSNIELKIMGIVGIRSGSKGMPGKNIRTLEGKPLVGWILETAKTSNYLNRFVVSTDSQRYADIVARYGVEVPCLRPQALAADTSTDFEYVKHMLEWLEIHENYKPDIVVRLMATTPLQKIEDIDASIEKLIKDPKTDSTVVIAEAKQHPMKALKIVQDGGGKRRLVSYFSESGRDVTPPTRQSFERAYFRANVITFRPSVIANTGSLTGDRVDYQICSQKSGIDIDNEIDFSFVEYLISQKE